MSMNKYYKTPNETFKEEALQFCKKENVCLLAMHFSASFYFAGYCCTTQSEYKLARLS